MNKNQIGIAAREFSKSEGFTSESDVDEALRMAVECTFMAGADWVLRKLGSMKWDKAVKCIAEYCEEQKSEDNGKPTIR